MTGLRRAVGDHPVLAAWVCSLLFWSAVIALRLWAGVEGIYYDENAYWTLGSELTQRFTLGDFTNQLRGVSFPLLVSWISSGLGPLELDERTTAVVISLIGLPLLAGVVVPSLVADLAPRRPRPGLLRILLFNAGLAMFWRDDAVRLLSDIPAWVAFAGAAAILVRIARRWRTGAARGWRVPAAAFAAGVLFAFAANTRSAYLVVALAAIVALPILLWRTAVRLQATILIAVLLGALIGFGPQLVVNRNLGAGWSIVPATSADTARFQLQHGLLYQRYDTYIGAPAEYPSAGMAYDNTDNLGSLDWAEATSLSAYASMAAREPVAIGQTFARHLFNGLDIRRPGTYVESIEAATAPLQVLNFAVLLAALGVLGIRSVRWWRARGSAPPPSAAASGRAALTWIGVLLALATAQTLVLAVETRFLLPQHVFLLAVLTLSADRADLPRRTATRVLAAGTGVVLVALAMWMSATVDSTLTPPIPTRASGSVGPAVSSG